MVTSSQLSFFDRANMLWDYFKQGNSELRNFYGIWTLILTISIKFNIDINLERMVVWAIFWVPVCTVVGYFFTKRVNIAANRTNPYTQDSILSAINLQQSLIHLYDYEETKNTEHLSKAKDEMEKAQELRRKWRV